MNSLTILRRMRSPWLGDGAHKVYVPDLIKELEQLQASALAQAAPLADADIEAVLGPCDDSDMGRHLRAEFIKSFKRVYFKLHMDRAAGIPAPGAQETSNG